MINKIFNVLILILLVLPIISAGTINVNTFPNHKIYIAIQSASSHTILDSSGYKPTNNGNVSITTSISDKDVDLVLILTKDGQTLLSKRFENVPLDQPIYINFYPAGDISYTVGVPKIESIEENNTTNMTEEVLVNQTLEIETTPNTTQEPVKENIEELKNAVVTGEAISEDETVFLSKTTLYIILGIIGIIILIIVVFLIIKKIKRSGNKENKIVSFKIKDGKESSYSNTGYDKKINEIERKIKEAQSELNEIKSGKGRLEEVRKRFEGDKEELRRLGGLDY